MISITFDDVKKIYILSLVDSVIFLMVDGKIDCAAVLIAKHNPSFDINCLLFSDFFLRDFIFVNCAFENNLEVLNGVQDFQSRRSVQKPCRLCRVRWCIVLHENKFQLRDEAQPLTSCNRWRKFISYLAINYFAPNLNTATSLLPSDSVMALGPR